MFEVAYPVEAKTWEPSFASYPMPPDAAIDFLNDPEVISTSTDIMWEWNDLANLAMSDLYCAKCYSFEAKQKSRRQVQSVKLPRFAR